ncbi:hypothetical protein HN51_035198 [Arachis hypogaea]|uniref:Uncharacterized protein n=1 Tax=Arachis hypogaea TaxID=3818 RepID=A0A445A5I4_ARAHY|nr:uncharacterized protein LOC107634265 [Arachis ipaensis]XP_025643347.1 uncharacterized protein LOC112737596 [Arachis hypogaea]QHO00192.1 uncharacterized protein DS421_13g404380 [Arachis hypogaea]RYR21668.1 hypothetical protein Ahy_B03g066983 [Arachis hypogaea]
MRNFSKLNKMFLCFRPVLDIDDAIKPENKTLLFPKGSSKFSQGLRIMQQPPKKTIIRVFQTILNRRACQKKNRYNRINDSFGALETKSLLKSTLSTRPSTPKATLESKNLQTKQEQKRTKQTKFESYGIYLILMSLLFTVIWGKLVGIILTSMWLYLIITLCNSPSYYCSQKRLQRCSYPTGIDHRGNYGKCYSKHHN